jgi:hypothetical protein
MNCSQGFFFPQNITLTDQILMFIKYIIITSVARTSFTPISNKMY